MRQLLIISILTSSFSSSFSQVKLNFNININAEKLKVRHYELKNQTTNRFKQVIVTSDFNSSELNNIRILDSLNNSPINVISVDYVFTEYKDSLTQDRLNNKRIFELYLAAPFIVNQGMTKWRFVEQLGFTKDEDARKLFHGFVINYVVENSYLASTVDEVKGDIKRLMHKPEDSSIYKIFTRNPQFTNEVIVTDFTCSMTPYYLEVVAWYSLHQFQNEVSFSFFNDGDGKPNDKKLIGKTGGVHQCRTNSLDTISKCILETIKTGCSGDNPENDIEAILRAIDKNPNAKEIILIADNWSDMRDYNLRYQVNKPVRIILCGTKYGINPQYLNLAMITKGSIHTLEEDLDNLYKLSDGMKFMLGGQTFIVTNGRIEKFNKI